MRVATKLTLVFGALGFIIFGSYGLQRAEHEERLLRTSAEHELRDVGRILQVAIEHALRDEQTADIAETLSGLEPIAPAVDILVFDNDEGVLAASASSPASPDFERQVARTARRTERPALRDSADGSWLALGLPLLDDRGQTVGSVVVGYPLGGLHAEIRDARRDVALVVVGFVALTIVIGFLLGTIHVGRPLQRLVDAMSRVRSGDLDADLRAAPRQDEVGELTMAFNAMTQELRTAQARVADEVERRRALEVRLSRADKLIAVGQLAATIAHEIGSPLQVLVGRARALATRDYPADRITKHANIIADQAERIAGIVEELLSYARQRPGRAQATSLPEAAQSVLELLVGEATRRQVTVACQVHGELPEVVCDAARFQQVVFNLVRNALDASPPGSRIDVSFDAESVDEGDVSHVRMTVRDEGTGISPENLPHVFEPFFTTRTDAGGTGLGLVVARSIVREEQGTIELDSRVNAGTRVVVRYPVERAES